MKVLVVGGGGREHTLAWALRRSPRVETLRCAPGNAGIELDAEPISIGAEDVNALVDHVAEVGYDLVVVGPEAPLVAGLADRLSERGVAVFGPSAEASLLEGSKVFAKEFMARQGIPTARFGAFDDVDAARAYLRSSEVEYPLVVKADGLAAGKGVLIVEDAPRAEEAAAGMLAGRSFGDAGRRVVIEELLRGREASFFVLSDGDRYVDLATCQDYKRAEDGDGGLNTGGMGTYSPSVYLDDALRERILREVVDPTIDGMRDEGRPYRGVLYVGLMLTEQGPKVLEYNCRFGDPEAQVLLPRLDGDWFELLHACARGDLGSVRPRWKSEAAVCVVMASGGYPGAYEKGRLIHGLEEVLEMPETVVFHAGTRRDERGRVVTAGGRVLGVTALGADLASARHRAYDAVSRIHWEEERHRTDIALDAVEGGATA
jgi:phosphoribosylamine--glycine ligase